MRGPSPQAVILASDTGARLYPLNSPATPKALLPVGNRPLLSFPLAMIEHSGIHHVLVVSGQSCYLFAFGTLFVLYKCDRPLLSFPLATIEHSGVHHVLMVGAIHGSSLFPQQCRALIL